MYWEQVVDSEYAVLNLNLRLKSDILYRLYKWADGAGYGSLTGNVFEIYVHRLAADNRLKLYMSEYEPRISGDPKTSRYSEMKRVSLKTGEAVCSGTTNDHKEPLKRWMNDDESTYWFPACQNFPNIDSIVKLVSKSGKYSVAYLQMTVALEHSIKGKQLEDMNAIFFSDDIKKTGGAEPPIYIAVCPDIKSCKRLVLAPSVDLLEAKKVCRVFVGYCDEAAYAIAADSSAKISQRRPEVDGFSYIPATRKRSRQQ